MSQQLTESLQEAVLAVLAFNLKQGALISAQVRPEHFDQGVYNQIASAVIEYRRKYSKPPGAEHLEDLFTKKQLDPNEGAGKVLRRTLQNLFAVSESINAEYVAAKAQDFVREQNLRSALFTANERYQQGGDDVVSEVEGILNGALRFRQTTMDAGTFLTDVDAAIDAFQNQAEGYALGIPYLDSLGFGPKPKQLLLYIAPKSSGKTWFCTHVGKQALLQRGKVVHVSLEMEEDRILGRYYQSFFGIARRPGKVRTPVLEFDELERLNGFRLKEVKPKLDFRDPNIRKILKAKVKPWGARLERLVVKSFPSGTLTMNQLRSYLDYLELVHKFYPTLLVVDYPRLMKMRADNLRLEYGQLVVDLRGLAQERNMALVAPVQSNREGIGAKRVSSRNASEDISTVFTADEVLSYSRTPAEEQLGLGRLTVEHAREMESGTQLLISQSYATGQYVTGSAYVTQAYWEKLKQETGEDGLGEA